tara:strand:- start:30 stop:485 length:456 start_codon:yes stop_codon:yes gene_type:complete
MSEKTVSGPTDTTIIQAHAWRNRANGPPTNNVTPFNRNFVSENKSVRNTYETQNKATNIAGAVQLSSEYPDPVRGSPQSSVSALNNSMFADINEITQQLNACDLWSKERWHLRDLLMITASCPEQSSQVRIQAASALINSFPTLKQKMEAQ